MSPLEILGAFVLYLIIIVVLVVLSPVILFIVALILGFIEKADKEDRIHNSPKLNHRELILKEWDADMKHACMKCRRNIKCEDCHWTKNRPSEY